MNAKKNNSSQKKYWVLLQKRYELTEKQLEFARNELKSLQNNLQQRSRFQSLSNQAEKIRQALERLAAGCYGFCQACCGPIEEQRLHMIPETELCLNCRQKEETQRRCS